MIGPLACYLGSPRHADLRGRRSHVRPRSASCGHRHGIGVASTQQAAAMGKPSRSLRISFPSVPAPAPDRPQLFSRHHLTSAESWLLDLGRLIRHKSAAFSSVSDTQSNQSPLLPSILDRPPVRLSFVQGRLMTLKRSTCIRALTLLVTTLTLLVTLPRPALGATTLTAPTGLTATAASGSSISLRWVDTNTSESSTAIEWSTNGTTFAQIATVGQNVTTYSSTGLSSGVLYYYRVRALGNGSNASPYSSVASAKTLDTIAPSTPINLTVSAVSCGQVNASWTTSTDTGGSGLKGYNLYRNGIFVKQVLVPATSTSDTGVAGSTTYNYTVSAVDYAGNQSAQSAARSATTPACSGDTTAPSVPTGVSAVGVSCSQINVSWGASTDTGGSGLKGYNLYVWRNSAWTFLKVVLAPATSTSDTGLSPSTTYFYAVSAYDNAGHTSALSNYGSGATGACTTTTSSSTTTTLLSSDKTPPSVPTGLSTTPASCSQINLAWNAASDTGSGVRAYNVYRGGAFLKQVLAPTRSTSDVGLAGS